MDALRDFLLHLYRTRNTKRYDALVPVIGDEGVGKSTLILRCNILWHEIRGEKWTDESILGDVVWDDREEFKRLVSEQDQRRMVCVMDAARVLHKQDAMTSEQKDLQKDLLDIRTKEFLMMFGYQDFGLVPSNIQQRRAKYVLRIPSRGDLEGYSRASIDDRLETGEWPEPDLVDSFPSLESWPLWDAFEEADEKRKMERIAPASDEDADDTMSVTDVVGEVKEQGVQNVVSIHGGNHQPYIDADLIEVEYGLSARDAKKVKKLLERDDDVKPGAAATPQ